MKPLLRDSLFCGVISLQIAVAVFCFGRYWGESLSLPFLLSREIGRSIETGSQWPFLTGYDEQGRTRPMALASHSPQAIIVRGTCSCADEQVSNWIRVAHQRGEQVTLILPTDRAEEVRETTANHWTGRVLRIRPIELEQMGLMKEGALVQLPLMAHLDANGAILGVQRSS